MTDFFFDYGLFLAKSMTIVTAIALLVLFITFLAGRKQGDKKDFIQIKKLNKKYKDLAMAMQANMPPTRPRYVVF